MRARFQTTTEYAAGEYVWRHPGSMHETFSEEGCTILAIYRKPNIFAKSAGFVTGGKVDEPKA